MRCASLHEAVTENNYPTLASLCVNDLRNLLMLLARLPSMDRMKNQPQKEAVRFQRDLNICLPSLLSGSFLPSLGRQPKSTRVEGADMVMQSMRISGQVLVREARLSGTCDDISTHLAVVGLDYFPKLGIFNFF
jgi:hypothetical protein